MDLDLLSDMFTELQDQEPIDLHFFSPEEMTFIEEAIAKFHSGEEKRGGGSFLDTHVKTVELAIAKIVKHVGLIKDFLNKVPTKGKKSKESIQGEAIENIASTWKNIPEAIIRSFTIKLLGEEKALEFTLEELPYVIALYQVKQEIMEVK